jgi:hypothetical protein
MTTLSREINCVQKKKNGASLRTKKKQLWGVSDLPRGINRPLSMLTEWSSIFQSPKSIVMAVLHKFVGYLKETGHGADLEAAGLCDDRLEADARYYITYYHCRDVGPYGGI